jgi:hypothetical protein
VPLHELESRGYEIVGYYEDDGQEARMVCKGDQGFSVEQALRGVPGA